MTATANRPEVGAVMIYRKEYGADPVTVNVAKVSKAGWVKFTHADGSESSWYKRDGDGYERADRSRLSRTHSRLYPFSEERLAALKAEHARQQEEYRRKAEEHRARVEATEKRQAEELAAVRAALGGDWRTALLAEAETGDDLGRVYMIRLPVRPDAVERKGAHQIVLVRVRKEVKSWLNESEQWAAYPTYADKTTSSWSSISPETGPDADAAVWNALRYLHANW